MPVPSLWPLAKVSAHTKASRCPPPPADLRDLFRKPCSEGRGWLPTTECLPRFASQGLLMAAEDSPVENVGRGWWPSNHRNFHQISTGEFGSWVRRGPGSLLGGTSRSRQATAGSELAMQGAGASQERWLPPAGCAEGRWPLSIQPSPRSHVTQVSPARLWHFPSPGRVPGAGASAVPAPSVSPRRPESPLIFAASFCGDASSWHWNSGLGSPRVGLAPLASPGGPLQPRCTSRCPAIACGCGTDLFLISALLPSPTSPPLYIPGHGGSVQLVSSFSGRLILVIRLQF